MQENKIKISDLMAQRFDVYYHNEEFSQLVNLINKSNISFKTLENVTILITDGAHQSPNSDSNCEYNYVTVKDIDNWGNIDLKNCNKISYDAFNSMCQNGCKPQEGDVLFSKDGTVGKVYRVKRDDNFVILSSLAILRPDLEQISSKYLECILQNNITIKLVRRLMGGTAIKRIILDNLKKVLIPVPSAGLQDQIVKIMSDANIKRQEKYDNAKNLLESINDILLKELNIIIPKIDNKKEFKTTISNILSSRLDPKYHQPKYETLAKYIKTNIKDLYSLEDICDEVISGQRPKGGVSQVKEGIPSLGGEHVLRDGTIETKNLKFIPEDFHKKQIKSKIKPLDIILVKDGATTGKVGIIPEEYPFKEANINEHVFILRCKKHINPYYILAFLLSEIGQTQIEREISGATIMGITKDSLKNILIPLPSYNTQILIANEYNMRLEQAQNLKKEADKEFEKSKARVERIILGEENL